MENNIIKEDNDMYTIASAHAICRVDGDYWFITRMNRCLYKMNLETKKVKIEAVLGDREGHLQFSKIIHYKNKLIITPRRADNIYVYNINTKEVHEKTLCLGGKHQISLFFSVCQVEQYIYILPFNSSLMIIFNMDTETYEIVSLLGKRKSKDLLICHERADRLGDNLYIPCQSEKCIFKYRISTKSIERIYPGNETISYSSIHFIDGKGWLIPFDVTNGIRIWNIETNDIEREISMPDSIIEQLPPEDKAAFFRTYYKDNKLYLCAYNIEASLIIDTNTFAMNTWNMPYDVAICRPNSGEYLHRISDVFKDDQRLFFINGVTGEWFYFENDKLKKLKIRTNYVDDDMQRKIYRDKLDYLFALVHVLNIKECEINNNIGKDIYSVV